MPPCAGFADCNRSKEPMLTCPPAPILGGRIRDEEARSGRRIRIGSKLDCGYFGRKQRGKHMIFGIVSEIAGMHSSDQYGVN